MFFSPPISRRKNFDTFVRPADRAFSLLRELKFDRLSNGRNSRLGFVKSEPSLRHPIYLRGVLWHEWLRSRKGATTVLSEDSKGSEKYGRINHKFRRISHACDI